MTTYRILELMQLGVIVACALLARNSWRNAAKIARRRSRWPWLFWPWQRSEGGVRFEAVFMVLVTGAFVVTGVLAFVGGYGPIPRS